MYCPECGKALSRPMKFCTHCGSQLNLEKTTETEERKNRFDDYVDGIFWTTVFGLGIILGGMFVIKEVLQLDQRWMIAYTIMSSAAFLTVFGIHVWQVIHLSREAKKANEHANLGSFDTNKLAGTESQNSFGEAVSVTEETTRTLRTIPKEKVTR